MFRNAKVGDRAYDILRGWGTIVAIKQYSEYPICFKADIDSFCTFTFDGKRADIDISPSLFWDEIKFKIPEKPFDLEEELRKLEVIEFSFDENSYLLFYDNEENSICYDCTGYLDIPFVNYFTSRSIYDFMDKIKDKNITREQFFTAYKKVFGGNNENM